MANRKLITDEIVRITQRSRLQDGRGSAKYETIIIVTTNKYYKYQLTLI